MSVTLWIIIAMVFYAVGEILSKMFANTPLPKTGILAVLCYTLNAACFLPALQKLNSLTILGTIWNICYVIVTLVIGLFVFGEPITTLQIVGLVFGLVSIVLLSI